jgi:hypothetical protein
VVRGLEGYRGSFRLRPAGLFESYPCFEISLRRIRMYVCSSRGHGFPGLLEDLLVDFAVALCGRLTIDFEYIKIV